MTQSISNTNIPSIDKGMIFVRINGIIETMVSIPLMAVGLFAVAITMPMNYSFASRNLELMVYPDGSTHVSSTFDIDQLEPDYQADLFGPSIDNFVAKGENGFLLSSEIIGDKAIIDTFGSSSITLDYDIHDLVSKEGRVWTFSFNSPLDYTLLMPQNSVIVGMTVLPMNMDVINEHTKLELTSGPTEITYVLGQNTNIETNPKITSNQFDTTTILIISSMIAIVTSIIFINKKRKLKQNITSTEIKSDTSSEVSLDTQSIFNKIPEMRDDDKEIVKFISQNGGQALESELRKKFLQPRTTMWRAVKRLERLGIIEIHKKDLQNLVKLKNAEGKE